MSKFSIALVLIIVMAASSGYASDASANDAYPDVVDFSTLSLDELESYETEGLAKREQKAHKKALKKAKKAAKREARKNSSSEPYCSRLARSRGQCY